MRLLLCHACRALGSPQLLGNARVRVDLRSLHRVVSAGGTRRRMNLLDEHGHDLDPGMVLVHVGSERVAQRSGHVLAAGTEHRIQLARIEVAQYQPTRGLPDEGFGVRNRIDGLHGGGRR